MDNGIIIKENNKLYVQYKKDLFDGIFHYPDYYTNVIEFKTDLELKEGDKVLFEIETICDGESEFDFMDKDVAKIITKI
jgi:hypothetical protein